MFDSVNGFIVQVDDLTAGTSGRMIASKANGFASVNFQPNSHSCTISKHAFHPEYSTSNEDTRVPWAAHSYNVAFSDEIGHWEYCNKVNADAFASCARPGGFDTHSGENPLHDDLFCFPYPGDPSTNSTLVKVKGCLSGFDSDVDFDGVSYQHTWPGSRSDPEQDALLNPSPIRVTSPLFNGTQSYDRVAFEADLPRIEADDLGGNCDRTTGADCENPPPGADFYPFYSTGTSDEQCVWQLGGANIPETTHTFGGSSKEEYGSLLKLVYPGPEFKPFSLYNDFRNVLSSNPC
jgi:hypothetical protein